MIVPTRRWLYRIHMVGGLILALYATALGLSGAALVFRDELTPAPGSLAADPAGPDAALATIHAHYPDWSVLSLTWPNRLHDSWMAYLLRGSDSREVFVSGGHILAERAPGGAVMSWLLRFHTNFHSGSTGRWLNGIGALALIGMAITGLFLYYRPKGGWRSWHHNTGLAAAAFLLVIGITGGYYVWQRHYIAAVDRWFPRTPAVSLPQRGPAKPLAMSDLTTRATKELPGLRIYRASAAMDQPVQVTLLHGDELEFHKVSNVVLDPVTGHVLQVNRYEDRPPGNSILAWFSVLHFGRFAGLPGRLLWFVLGLTLPALSVTGVWLYWRRRNV